MLSSYIYYDSSINLSQYFKNCSLFISWNTYNNIPNKLKKHSQMEKELTKSRIPSPPITLDLLKNFHEAYNLASNPKVQSKLHEPLKQKLLFLANSIFASDQLLAQINSNVPVDLKEFFFLKKHTVPKDFETEMSKEGISEEFANLMNMGLETKLDLYIKSAMPIIPELQNLITSPNTKKGILQVKYPGTLRSWGNKFMILDYTKKSLLIFKEIKSLTPEKELKLDVFAIRWIGNSKGKFCFSLFTQNIKPKCYNCGGENENWVKEWYEELRKVINPEGFFIIKAFKSIGKKDYGGGG